MIARHCRDTSYGLIMANLILKKRFLRISVAGSRRLNASDGDLLSDGVLLFNSSLQAIT